MHRLLVLAALLAIIGCSDQPDRPATFPQETGPGADEEVIPFRRDGSLSFIRDGEEQLQIEIEIADTDSARTRGLMQRESLPERSGMLFIFDDEAPRGFWMANTPLAL